MEIFEIIKNLCEEKNVKISALERDLNFSRGSIYKMAESAPSADKVRKLADYFNVSADYLLGRSKEPSSQCVNILDLETFIKMCNENKINLTSDEKLKLVQAILSDSNIKL